MVVQVDFKSVLIPEQGLYDDGTLRERRLRIIGTTEVAPVACCDMMSSSEYVDGVVDDDLW